MRACRAPSLADGARPACAACIRAVAAGMESQRLPRRRGRGMATRPTEHGGAAGNRPPAARPLAGRCTRLDTIHYTGDEEMTGSLHDEDNTRWSPRPRPGRAARPPHAVGLAPKEESAGDRLGPGSGPYQAVAVALCGFTASGATDALGVPEATPPRTMLRHVTWGGCAPRPRNVCLRIAPMCRRDRCARDTTCHA